MSDSNHSSAKRTRDDDETSSDERMAKLSRNSESASDTNKESPNESPNADDDEMNKDEEASPQKQDDPQPKEIEPGTTDVQEPTSEPNDPPPQDITADKNPTLSIDSGIVVDREGGDLPTPAQDSAAPASVAGEPTATSDPPGESTPSIPSGLPPGIEQDSHVSQSPIGAPAAAAQAPSSMLEERGEIPQVHTGKVIGRGGEMIRDLQARSGARIDVDQNVPHGVPRVITYRGTREQIDMAKHLVRLLVEEGIDETQLPLGLASQEILIIPANTVGKIIGRGGEMCREIQSRSQAKIQVDHAGVSGVTGDQRQVTITGPVMGVTKAKEMVTFIVSNPLMDAMTSLTMLCEEKLRGGQWGSGHPYPNLPNNGYNMAPEVGSPFGQAPGGYQQPGLAAYGAPAHAAATPAYGAYPGPSAIGAPETDVIYIQKQYLGRIIGQKGITVNDLQRRSGTDIQIQQNVPDGRDAEIHVKGVRSGIEMVKRMVQEIIEVGPAHPYAGGSDNYAGGGGGAYGSYQQQARGAAYQQPQGYGHAAYGQVAHGQAAFGQAAYAPQATYGQAPSYGQPAYSQPAAYGAYGQSPAPYGAPPPVAPATTWKTASAPNGQIYYYNEVTGETQWEKPAGM